MVTALYAALLGLFFVYLSVAVVKQRKKLQVSCGDGGHAHLQRVIRVHGNFAEYVPFALIGIFLAEYSGLQPMWVHVLGIMLLAGRVSHAYGFSREPELLTFRALGMVLTFGVFLLSALAILALFISRQII